MSSPGERLRPSLRGWRAGQPNAAAPRCPPGASGRLPCAHSGATGELKTEAKIQQLYQHGFSSNGVARASKWGGNVQAEFLMERLAPEGSQHCHHTQLRVLLLPWCFTARTQFEELERAQHICDTFPSEIYSETCSATCELYKCQVHLN